MGVLTLILKMLTKMFGQSQMWEAFKVIADRRTQIKMVKLEEEKDLREIKTNIKETRAKKKLLKKETRLKKKIEMQPESITFRTSSEGMFFIKGHEGLRLKAYDDLQPSVDIKDASEVKGTLTVGYGHTGSDVTPQMVITEEEAERLLSKDMSWSEDAVKEVFEDFGWLYIQNRFDALVSWVYNTGGSNLEDRNLIKAIDDLNLQEANGSETEEERLQVDKVWNAHYTTSKGVKLEGLVRRRKEESVLFLT